MKPGSGSGERQVDQEFCGTYTQNRWQIDGANLSSMWYDFQTISDYHISIDPIGGGHLCLAARGTGEVQTVATTCDESLNQYWIDQRWSFVLRTDGTYRYFMIKNDNTHLCLAARDGSGSPVIVTTCDYMVGQQWADQHWQIA
jgi:hypothetical protein